MSGSDSGMDPKTSDIDVLDSWAIPGKYWFVMPPKPGTNGLHTLYMNNGKAFDGPSHAACRYAAAEYLRGRDVVRCGKTSSDGWRCKRALGHECSHDFINEEK